MINELIKEYREKGKKAVDHVLHEFNTLHTGKASPTMVESVRVDAHGSVLPLKQLAAITTPDARTLAIEPWDKSLIKAIDKAIRAANIGFNPVTSSTTVRCPIPELSRERRQELAKRAHSMAEEGKVAIRVLRQHTLDALKKDQKAGTLSEDAFKPLEKQIQTETDKMNADIAQHLKHKEAELIAL